MRLLIQHQTEYRYTQPQARVVQLLRLTPTSHIGQNIVHWRIDVDCDARLKQSRDGYGNIISMLYLAGPVERIGLRVTGEVLTEDRAGAIDGAVEPLPATVYTRSTPLTGADADIHDLVATCMSPKDDMLSRAHALNETVHKQISCNARRSTEVRPASAIVAAGSGCSMDLAHVLISAARVAGLAARFVAGYIYQDDADGGHQESSHFWAEFDIPGFGWIGFDPANDMCPNDHYVRVAKGLDFRDAAPISGARVGGGHEVLNIGVDVSVSQSQLQS